MRLPGEGSGGREPAEITIASTTLLFCSEMPVQEPGGQKGNEKNSRRYYNTPQKIKLFHRSRFDCVYARRGRPV